MALVAWYPLNGDIENHGVGNASFSSTSGSIFVNNGKTGKALQGTDKTFSWTAEQTASLLNSQEFSISFWLYVDAETGSKTNRGMLFGSSSMTPPNNRRYSLFQYPSCNDLHWSWQNDNASGTFLGDILYGVLPSYKWTHVCVIYKNPTLYVYLNNELKKTSTGTQTSTNWNVVTPVLYQNPYTRKCDYRIFNHAISAKEREEIYKSCILHYDFTTKDTGKIYDGSGFNNHGTFSGTPTYSTDTKSGSVSLSLNGSTKVTLPGILHDGNLQDHTVTCWWYKTKSKSNQKLINLNTGYYLQLGSNDKAITYINSGNNDHYRYSSTLAVNNWYFLAFSYKRPVTATSTSEIELGMYVNGVNTGSAYIKSASVAGLSMPATTELFTNCEGLISDVKVFARKLTDAEILEMYQSKAQIDKDGNIYCGEFIEEPQNNIINMLENMNRRSSYTGTLESTEDGYVITNKNWIESPLYNINPNYDIKYKITYSNKSANNQLYIGFEQYNSNNESNLSNQGTKYQVAEKVVRDHYTTTGTINKNTFASVDSSGNSFTLAKIKLRILNNWNGATGDNLITTIHSLEYWQDINPENNVALPTKNYEIKSKEIIETPNVNIGKIGKDHNIYGGGFYEI